MSANSALSASSAVSGSHSAEPLDAELEELFVDVIEASGDIVGLDLSQQDGWASGVLASWRTELTVDSPGDVDEAFAAWCDTRTEDAAGDGDVAGVLGAAVRRLIASADAETCEVTGCWLVESADSRQSSASAVIGFQHRDESEHCLLAEIDDSGALIDLHVGPSAADVLPDEEALDGMGVEFLIHEGDPAETAAVISEAWNQSAGTVAGDGPTESMLLNEAFARTRLRGINPALRVAEFASRTADAIELHLGMTEEDIAEANARSVEALHRGLQVLRNQPPPQPFARDLISPAAEPLRAGPRSLSHPEREALAFLEWADWLGVALGLGRTGPGAPMHGDALVDFINRCPEVTSSVSRNDRPIVTYALNVAVAWWADLGLVEDGLLNELGFWILPRAISSAWNGAFDA